MSGYQFWLFAAARPVFPKVTLYAGFLSGRLLSFLRLRRLLRLQVQKRIGNRRGEYGVRIPCRDRP